jgi:Bax protein
MIRSISLLLLLFPLSLMAKTPDFSAMKDIKARQKAFFSYLLPAAKKANKSILKDRNRILSLQNTWQEKGALEVSDKNWLQQLAKNYKLNGLNFTNKEGWKALLNRVDTIPVSMLLAQAANESAWGTSRFAKSANNYFGQWCFKQGCGVVPKMRPRGRHYEVQRFMTPFTSIMSYLKNLNTNHGYLLLRRLRATAREHGQRLTGFKLAQGLINYSQRKQAYVNSIRGIISHHHLEQFDIA